MLKRLAPKLIAKTIAIGESATIQRRMPPVKIAAAVPLVKASSATIPVSRMPDVM